MPELGGGWSFSPNYSRLQSPQTTAGRSRSRVWVLCHLSTSCHSLQALGEKPRESAAFSGSLPSDWEERPSFPTRTCRPGSPAAPAAASFQPIPRRKVSPCARACAAPACHPSGPGGSLASGMRVSLPSLEPGSRPASAASLHLLKRAPFHSTSPPALLFSAARMATLSRYIPFLVCVRRVCTWPLSE